MAFIFYSDTFNESVSSIIERKVRGWLSGVIDDMRRSSPVQQWLDSLPADTENVTEQSNENIEIAESKSDNSKTEQTVSQNTVIEPADKTIVEGPQECSKEEKNLDVPYPKDLWKRKSLDSGVLTSTPQSESIKKKLQRDHSIQSEGYVPKFKNPLLRDQSLQVILIMKENIVFI